MSESHVGDPVMQKDCKSSIDLCLATKSPVSTHAADKQGADGE